MVQALVVSVCRQASQQGDTDLCVDSWPLLSSRACHSCCDGWAPASMPAPLPGGLASAAASAAAAALLRLRAAGLAGALRARPAAGGGASAPLPALPSPHTSKCCSLSACDEPCWPRNSKAAARWCRTALQAVALPPSAAAAACRNAAGRSPRCRAASAATSSAAACRARHQACGAPPASAASSISCSLALTAASQAAPAALPPSWLLVSCAAARCTMAAQ